MSADPAPNCYHIPTSPPEPRLFVRKMLQIFIVHVPRASQKVLRELNSLASHVRKSHRFQVSVEKSSGALKMGELLEKLEMMKKRETKMLEMMAEQQEKINELEEQLAKKAFETMCDTPLDEEHEF